MNKQGFKENEAAFKKITFNSTIALSILLILFLALSLYSTGKLSSQIKLITEHPFAVNGDISDIRTQLALMRIRTERLQSYNQPDDVNKVRETLNMIYEEMDLLMSNVKELYLGPDEDIEIIMSIFDEIQEQHEKLLDFAALSTSTLPEIAKYEETHLYPLYDQFDLEAQDILAYVRQTQQNIFTSADVMSKSTLLSSVLIVVAMFSGLFVFQHFIQKMTQKLYAKNRQFEILSDTIDETFLIFEKNQAECEFVSGSAERILGLSSDQLVIDRELPFQYMNEETVAQLRQFLCSEEKKTWETMIEYHSPLKIEPQWLHARFYLYDKDGEKKYIVTLADRTLERQSNQALQDALTSAQNANSAKRDFLSRMSHEIRTPMNAIIGMTTIAAASMDDRSRVEDCLEKISYSSKHLLMLINDVLDMSRIENNRMRLSMESFDLYQFINNFVSVIYPEANHKGLDFTEKTTGFSEKTTYIGDTLRLNQILLNLTSNAIKFTPEGGSVRLEVTHLSPRNQKVWIRFVVSDTGIGMDEEGLRRLYTPFEQADDSIARKYGGTGLGMSITQNLISLMGGHISVKSKPGQGTTFTVELPFEQSDLELQPFTTNSLEALEVLVTDDEQDICEHTVLLLKKLNIHAEWVLNGEQAVERVVSANEKGNAFDVCLIDWKMPDMDGIETTRRIRQQIGWNTPIIIISGYDWSEIEEEARAAGANAFISKPLFQSSLYNVLMNVTNGAMDISGYKAQNDSKPLFAKRLLLAEDNTLNLEIASTLLEFNGAIVESAENGQEAITRFLSMEPGYYDAILMDVQMPVMDGCEAAKHIRSCGRPDAATIPIIATTANAFSEDVSTVLSAGMNAHISKPIDIQQLCSTLSQYI